MSKKTNKYRVLVEFEAGAFFEIEADDQYMAELEAEYKLQKKYHNCFEKIRIENIEADEI